MQQCVDVAGHEEHRVHRRELMPGERLVVAARSQLRADGRDRPFGPLVDLGKGPPLRPLVGCGVDDHATGSELLPRAAAQLVVAEHREEVRLVREQRQLDGGDPSPTTRLLPVLEGVGDLARDRHAVDPSEADPLHVPDDSDAHDRSVYHASHTSRPPRFTG